MRLTELTKTNEQVTEKGVSLSSIHKDALAHTVIVFLFFAVVYDFRLQQSLQRVQSQLPLLSERETSQPSFRFAPDLPSRGKARPSSNCPAPRLRQSGEVTQTP